MPAGGGLLAVRACREYHAYEHQRDTLVRLLGRGRAHGWLNPEQKSKACFFLALPLPARNSCLVQLFCQIMRACNSPD